jgi:acyl-CoA reductase-like NAD-dependent aldehyde dehydrogenase
MSVAAASWIAGSPVTNDSATPVELIEPATGRVLGTLVPAESAEVDLAVVAARSAFDGPWRRTSATERSRLLHRFADLIAEERDELAVLESRNVGKASSSVKAEIAGAIETLRFFASAVGAESGRSSALGGSLITYSVKDPVGVCALVVPWNYPLLMSVWKLAPALAAGCTVVLKPDIKTPLSALRLVELAERAGIPEGVVNVVPGGPETGAYLVAHPAIDKVSFTGSTATGEQVMRLASSPIKRLTLELGGKSPNLIFADANLTDAIPSSCWSIFYGAGQSCEARSRILVERSVHDDVVAGLIVAARKIVVGDPAKPETQVGSLISTAHRDRVHGFVRRAQSAGATVVLGGNLPSGPGAFYAPTILTNVRQGSEIEQEEVFGPVVSVQAFDDEDEAVRLANSTRFGLFATVWTGNPARAHRVASRLQSGMVGLNVPYTAFPGVGFGGHKQSGFGRELSLQALNSYTEEKSIIVGTGARDANPFRL